VYKTGDEPLKLDTQKLLSSVPQLTTPKIKVTLPCLTSMFLL